MTELGQLEGQWQEFAKRKVHVVVVSMEGPKAATATQADFPHLVVVSDAKKQLSEAVQVIYSAFGEDLPAPTTILVDGSGTVRWTFRPDRVLSNLSPSDLLAAIDREMPAD